MPTYRSAKLKMHRKFIIGSVATLAIIGGVFGTHTVVPYVTSSAHLASSSGNVTVTTDVGAGNVDLWDLSKNHTFSLQVSQDNLDQMLSDYQNNDEKTWVKADLTIDGVTIENVGIRLKGNSTLRALSGNSNQGFPGGGGGMPPGMEEQQGDQDQSASETTTNANADSTGTVTLNFADDATTSSSEPSTSAAEQNTQQQQGQQGGAPGGSNYGIDINDPSTWPILISFDKYQKGRVYQGMTEISIRPGIPSVNEYEAVKVTEASNQATQNVGFTTLSVNGGATTTRLIIQIPDENYAASLGNGILFKAKADSNFSYQGDDQTTYTDQFKQINGEGDGDIQPIINFLKWIDSASDEEFDEHLADYVDVDSFARYVATQNLIANSDDMAGPGKNYYLWYDFDTKKLSVVSWDLNMSMENNTSLEPTESASMGGGGGGGMGGPAGQNGQQEQQGQQGQPQGEAPAEADSSNSSTTTTTSAAAGTNGQQQHRRGGGMGGQQGFPGGGQMPSGMGQPPQMDGNKQGGNGGHGGGGGGMTSGNTLKEKFLASSAFRESYLKAYWEVYDEIYGDDAATNIIDQVASEIPVSDNTSQETIDQAVEEVKTWVAQRKAYLESIRSTSDPALTGTSTSTSESTTETSTSN
ncbi:MAG: CotH kinase family protein [Corynebacterium sp.]|nr:CotH kinase family protein [Corynebacterium sp.]